MRPERPFGNAGRVGSAGLSRPGGASFLAGTEDPSRILSRRHPRTVSESERGFTLLEVLVALLIAAIGLGALFGGTLGGLRAADLAGRTEEALSRARSRLAVLGQAAPLAAGDSEGDDGGSYRWRVRVAPLAIRPAGPGEPSLALYDVEVTVTWGSGRNAREVALRTRRAGTAPPPPP